jgi:hypothetical protein
MPAVLDHFLHLARAYLSDRHLEWRPTVQLGVRRAQEPACASASSCQMLSAMADTLASRSAFRLCAGFGVSPRRPVAFGMIRYLCCFSESLRLAPPL